jgi:TetR/AcrR family transcriptional repressor of bet genes
MTKLMIYEIDSDGRILKIMTPKIGMEDIRRQQVIKGAKRCIVKTGIHNFSMRDIANEAGVSTGIIYHYFSNKDDVLAQVLKEVFQKTHQSVREKVDHLERFEDKLDTYLYEISQAPLNNEEFYRLFMNYLGLAPYKTEVRKITEKFISSIQKYIEDIIDLGIEQGIVKKDKKNSMAPIISSLAMGIAMQWMTHSEGFQIEKANEHWIRMVVQYIKSE